MMLPTALVIMAALGVAVIWFYFHDRNIRLGRGRPSHALPLSADATSLDRSLHITELRHPGETGLRLLIDSTEAFNARLKSIKAAGRSLDLQYYYWKADLTGRLLCRELVLAADRGARVRLLIDDINARGFDSSFLALDSHPNIEVRLFNPVRSRSNALRRSLELVLKYFSATRRMHNKCWIADGRLAIIGGRNIGDPYFDAAEGPNFQDVDLLVTGLAIRKAEALFDAYWNSEPAVPIRALHRLRRPKLAKLRRRLDEHCNTRAAKSFMGLCEAASSRTPPLMAEASFRWARNVEVLADPPGKARGESREAWIDRRIESILQAARTDLKIISPYFIPGRAGLEIFEQLASTGVKISILTNSLAATDVLAVHGAYANYRRQLAGAGIALYELKPDPGRNRASLFGSSTASLHTKAFIVDGRQGFVGSFNLDPRSASINTEMGILFEHPGLVKDLDELVTAQCAPESSYAVTLGSGGLSWTGRNAAAEEIHWGEPQASLRRRAAAWFIGLLPIESQL
jgi:putative cardiolipin synthase